MEPRYQYGWPFPFPATYHPRYRATPSNQAAVDPGLAEPPVITITEDTSTTRYILDGDKAIVEDNCRRLGSFRRFCHLSVPQFIWFLKSRAAAVFLVKLEVTEEDFCTYVVPGCRQYGPLFEVLWPIIQSSLEIWTNRTFDPINL